MIIPSEGFRQECSHNALEQFPGKQKLTCSITLGNLYIENQNTLHALEKEMQLEQGFELMKKTYLYQQTKQYQDSLKCYNILHNIRNYQGLYCTLIGCVIVLVKLSQELLISSKNEKLQIQTSFEPSESDTMLLRSSADQKPEAGKN